MVMVVFLRGGFFGKFLGNELLGVEAGWRKIRNGIVRRSGGGGGGVALGVGIVGMIFGLIGALKFPSERSTACIAHETITNPTSQYFPHPMISPL